MWIKAFLQHLLGIWPRSYRVEDILDPGLVLQQFYSLDGSIENLVSTLSQLVQELSLSP